GQHLFLRDGDEQGVDLGGRQQTNNVAQQQEQDAEVEQVRAPAQLALAQHLARARAPGVLLALEADQAAQQQHRQADVGITDEQQVKEIVLHGAALSWDGALGGSWARRRSAI